MENEALSVNLLPVAIVGIATEFPSGKHSEKNLSHQEFFQFLLKKLDAYEQIPSDRFNVASWKGDGQGQIITGVGAFLKNLSYFDPVEFGITAQDAKTMAVATRKLLELSFLAFIDSGIVYRGCNVGCFMSGVAATIEAMAESDEFEATGSFAGGPSMIANRVSYHLDLRGPSISTDSACSSTLTALHLAVQSLRAGECESAVIGGCQVNHRLIDWIGYSQGAVLAPDGKCKPFDASANGFSRAEGAACVVVKLLDHAIKDGDHIYGTILGTGINSSGSVAPVSAPVAAGQIGAMERAYQGLRRHPSEVDFVETHATGTAAGDPLEANWVGKKFGREKELLIGSVKGNTGHLEITSFLASLSKVCSMFQHGVIPPNVNFTTLNPAIKWKEYNMRVPEDITPLSRHNSGERPLVSICSSGIGGTNGHAVIEGPPPVVPRVSKAAESPVLLIAGGLSPRSASVLTEDLKSLATNHPQDLSAMSTVYARRSRSMTWRSFSIYLPDGTTHVPFAQPVLIPREKTSLVFILPGQGDTSSTRLNPSFAYLTQLHRSTTLSECVFCSFVAQNPEFDTLSTVGRQLFATYSVFRETILLMDKIHERLAGYSLITKTGLFDNVEFSPQMATVWPVSITLPALAMVQIALIDLLRSVGIGPDAVVGHSAGETVMMYASGACSKEMAMEIAIVRGNVMLLTTKGAMAALSCTPAEAQDIIEQVAGSSPTGKVELACYNDKNSITLSGLDDFVDQAITLAEEKGFLARKLHTSVPVHSSLMESCNTKFTEDIEAVFARYPGAHIPTIPTFSALTGSSWESSFDANYIWQGTRQPVQFVNAISAIAEKFPAPNFVEISPHPVLSAYVSNLCPLSTIICPMKRTKIVKPHDEAVEFLKAIGHVAVMGHRSIDLSALNGNLFSSIQLPLPEYPFARKHVPIYPESSAMVARQLASGLGSGQLLAKPGIRLGVHTHRDLAGHVIRGEPIMPAAGFLEMAFELGARVLRNVQFRSIMPLPSAHPLHVEVETRGCHWKISSRLPDRYDVSYKQSNRLHADGLMSCQMPEEDSDPIDLESIRARCKPFSLSKFYETLSYFAQYGPIFRRITCCYKGREEALVEVRAADTDLHQIGGYVFHPVVLDACFHIMIHPALTGHADRNVYYLPSKMQHVTLHEAHSSLPFLSSVFAHAVFRRWRPDGLLYDLSIIAPNGQPICTLHGIELARHFISIIPPELVARYDITYNLTEQSITRPQCGANSVIASDSIILDFKLGKEMKLKEQLQAVDVDGLSRVWIIADPGLDTAGARGFSRCLRKELLHVDVRLVTLATIWSGEERNIIINELAAMENIETEIYIEEQLSILVPRFVPLLAPVPDTFDPTLYWVLEDIGVSHPPLPTLAAHEVLVHVFSSSPTEANLFGFVGNVTDPGTTALIKGTVVLGITSGPLTNVACVHEGYLALLDDIKCNGDGLASLAIPMLIATTALGSGALAHPERLHNRRILVINDNNPTTLALLWMLSALGIQASSISSDMKLTKLSLLSNTDIVISGLLEDDMILMQNMLAPMSKVYFWRDHANGLQQAMCNDPWSIGETFRMLLGRLPRTTPDIHALSLDPVKRLPAVVSVVSKALFNPEKVYVLIGGIGSFGLYCAMWMHENGARKIVLTSRSGQVKEDNQMALRILLYLETLSDLQLELKSCDGSSVSDTCMLFENIAKSETEIGGVMLMATILADRPFTGHTEEAYFSVFPSKTGSFKALKAAYPIEKLDFLISLSSFMTIGNAGQTNYASANTVLDELLRPYKNAFSILPPAIVDTSIFSKGQTQKSMAHLTSWALSNQQVCRCIGEGIRMLHTQEFGSYIPELDWHLVQQGFGYSSLYNHLLPSPDQGRVDESDSAKDQNERIRALVLQLLDVEPQDFSPEVPFTAYGLDSLSAGQLAFALRPYITMTQVQLLADVNLVDVMKRINAQQNVECIDGQ
ncbi:polyketide synthase [Collybiopsis luxurians FD-317 M1]|uniref:Pks9 protein n=1 Tax=Collybiopsis luxurians FD-317 M1 TaxID=944289 RepID=A0A0D0D2D6_9AGAR|nr:polyketide synthase [Collybiopsis luxurians FD-317 M1]